MERYAMKELIAWKKRKGHKPLMIRGARQVGKTWLMKEFGRNEYTLITLEECRKLYFLSGQTTISVRFE